MSNDVNDRRCRSCGKVNRVGVVFCEACHTPLTKAAEQGLNTRYATDDNIKRIIQQVNSDQISETIKVNNDDAEDVRQPKRKPSTGAFHAGTQLNLLLIDEGKIITVVPTEHRESTIGRSDADSKTYPDVDLSPYGAYRNGISRRHASVIIKDNQLLIRDLASSNGTLVNGNRLKPEEWTHLHESDHVRMGNMQFVVQFRKL
jgi:hypothetical protein